MDDSSHFVGGSSLAHSIANDEPNIEPRILPMNTGLRVKASRADRRQLLRTAGVRQQGDIACLLNRRRQPALVRGAHPC
jgi:hypothetical protein